MRSKVNRRAFHALERLEALADRAPELLGAVGLVALGAAQLLEGLLSVLAVLLAFLAAVLLAVLPRVRELVDELRGRVLVWYLTRS